VTPPAVSRGQLLDDWELTLDAADPLPDAPAHVVAVRTADGRQAVLKVSPGEPGAHLALRHWAGNGAVELLRADPHRGALLLERADEIDLTTHWDLEAAEVVAQLYGRLHVPAPPQLARVTDVFAEWADGAGHDDHAGGVPRRLLDRARSLARELTGDQIGSDVLLHTNLHYANVRSARRAPWLAISPRPFAGDPHFELAPMLWQRWDELAGRVRPGVQARLATLVEVAGFDEDRARAWVVVRAVHRATRTTRTTDVPAARSPSRHHLTICISLAKAVQD
jgi:streptomycin 6-kinase